MHRACTPEEIARGVRILGRRGRYINGHTLNMNGAGPSIYKGLRAVNLRKPFICRPFLP